MHFTLIIYKQFNFCRFRASAYTKVDRLCAVFLYNGAYIHVSSALCAKWLVGNITKMFTFLAKIIKLRVYG